MSSGEADAFADSLNDYLGQARGANSEAALGHYFPSFIQNTFDTMNSSEAEDHLPFLEEHVATEGTKPTISVDS